MRKLLPLLLLPVLVACASTDRPAHCTDPVTRDQAWREVEHERRRLENQKRIYLERLDFLRSSEVAARREQLEQLKITLRSHEVDIAENDKRRRRLEAEQAACEAGL